MLAALAQVASRQARTVQTPEVFSWCESWKVKVPAPDSACTSANVGLRAPGAYQCVRYSPAPVPVTVTTARAQTVSPTATVPGAAPHAASSIVSVAPDGAEAAT